MTTTTAPQPNAAQQEANLWLPPQRMRKYQFAKAIGAVLFTLIFVGWLVIQWSNPTMRYITIALIAMTGWITFQSVWQDVTRLQGRQLAVEDNTIQLITHGSAKSITIDQIASAEWKEETAEDFGLYLYDHSNQLLAHLDEGFLADQGEARTFLGWARKRADLSFPVRWPETDLL